MNSKLSVLLVILLSVAVNWGCRKKESSGPSVTNQQDTTTQLPDLPTEDIDGAYFWYGTELRHVNGKDTMVSVRVTEEIHVRNDTLLELGSDVEDRISYGGPPQYYRYSSSNDSEIVFNKGSSSITYRFQRKLVVWRRYDSELYGVPGATAKWAPIHELQLEGERNWRREKKYYVNYSPGGDTTVALPDTLGNAFLLYRSVSGTDKSGLLLAGADSTGILYYERHYDYGPNSFSIIGSVSYNTSDDNVYMYYKNYSPYPNTFTFESY